MAGDEQFKDWFKQRRKSLEYTQEELASQVGCSVATIRGMEQGVLRPSRQLAQLVAAALEIPAEEQAAFTLWARGAAAGRMGAPGVFRLPMAEQLPSKCCRPAPTGEKWLSFRPASAAGSPSRARG